MNAIEKAKELIAMGERYDDAWAKYEEMTNPGDLLPLLRLLVECEEWVEYVEGLCRCGEPDCDSGKARALLAKLRSESWGR